MTFLLATKQTLAARCVYDPYGNTLSQSGPLAEGNVYRFSSKEHHSGTGLYYYGFRWYDPLTQRWLNRDPIGEAGGINLTRFVANDPVVSIDAFGLLKILWVQGILLPPQDHNKDDWADFLATGGRYKE